MNLYPIKHAVQWLEREQRNAEDDCGDPKCDECGVRRARQTIIDGLKLLHDSLSMASKGEHMTQPEALRLADELEAYHTASHHKEAAAELRRLHAQRDALLEALRLTHIECQHLHHAKKDQHALGQPCPVAARISAAIAKAEEKQ